MTPTVPRATQPAQARRFLMTVDLTFRGQDYRIREDVRDRSSVRPMEFRIPAPCSGCDYVIRKYSSYLHTPTLMLHPQCAITSGLLVAVGKSFETEDPR